jgi:hypothetical protein
VAATARALRNAKPDNDGVVSAKGPSHCGIEVSSASVERAIAFLNTLARELESRGQKLVPAGLRMQVTIPPDTVTFTLKERIEKRNHEPTLEELAKEEKLRKRKERESRLGIWSFHQERAYPEFDFARTGELSIEIAEEYVGGLRRNWKDGWRQRIEGLVNDIVGGIITYLAGLKARREEQERWQVEWRRQEQFRALALAREEREADRRKFLKHLVVMSSEADELRSVLVRLGKRVPASKAGELLQMLKWAEARLEHLEGQLTAEAISVALKERDLFPGIDHLIAPAPEEE